MLIIRHLTWNAMNVAHIARHDVTPEEAEQVCHGTPVVQQGKNGRYLVLGPTQAGRMLTIVIDPEPDEGEGVFYPVTARPASRRERAIYQNERGGEEE
jgi:uncharacterized DUF497 family protein